MNKIFIIFFVLIFILIICEIVNYKNNKNNIFSIENRVKFYMGDNYNKILKTGISQLKVNNLINKFMSYDDDNDYYSVNLSDLKNYDKNKRVLGEKKYCDKGYIKPMIKLLEKNPNKYILYGPGDRYMINWIPGLISKSRNVRDRNTILLKLNYDRHWKPIKEVKKNDIDWKKKNNKIIWRGVTTGFRNKQRELLIKKYFYNTNRNIDVGITRIVQGQYHMKKYKKNKMSKKEMLQSKFLISLEGNDVASGLKWQMYSNSVVFMPKPKFESWFMESKLIPNYHYILIRDDLSDLEEKYLWALQNRDKCKQISRNAEKYVKEFLDENKENKIMEKIIKIYMKNKSV